MVRILLPLIILLIAGGAFFVFTEPMITAPKMIDPISKQLVGGVLALYKEKQLLSTAINDARRLEVRIADLDTKLNLISDNQLKRLDTFLPDQVDEVQLIVDVNNIAARSGMKISDVEVSLAETERSNKSSKESSLANISPKVTPMTLSFSVTGTYSQMRSLIDNLGQSLQIMDINNLTFSQPESGGVDEEEIKLPTYNISLTTYFIK